MGLAIGLTLLVTLMLNGSGGSLAPGSWFHATVYKEHGIVVVFPALIGPAWELASTLPLLLVGLAATVLLWRLAVGSVGAFGRTRRRAPSRWRGLAELGARSHPVHGGALRPANEEPP